MVCLGVRCERFGRCTSTVNASGQVRSTSVSGVVGSVGWCTLNGVCMYVCMYVCVCMCVLGAVRYVSWACGGDNAATMSAASLTCVR